MASRQHRCGASARICWSHFLRVTVCLNHAAPTENMPIHAEVQEKCSFWYRLLCFHVLDEDSYITDLTFLQTLATKKLRLVFLAQLQCLCTSKWSPQICFIIQPSSPIPHTWPLCLLWSGFYFWIYIYFFVARSFAERGVLSVKRLRMGSGVEMGDDGTDGCHAGCFLLPSRKAPLLLHLLCSSLPGCGLKVVVFFYQSPWLLSGSLLLGLS